MRRLVIVAFGLLGLLAPTPAHAWWEYIEAFSGPGRFRGPTLDVRLICVLDDPSSVALNATRRAQELKQSADTPEEWASVAREYLTAAQGWTAAAGKNAADSQPILGAILALAEANSLPAAINAANLAEKTAAEANQDFFIAGSTNRGRRQSYGGIISGCGLKMGEQRRASLDLGMRFAWDNHPDFASNSRIMLTTLEPTFSWRVVKRGKFDIVDYGVGAGLYWFSSEAFPSFSGAFLEPVRLDFHAPDAVVKKYPWAAIPLFRWGLLVFPGGFEPEAFAATRPSRIDRDWVPSWGFFADMEPLLQKIRN